MCATDEQHDLEDAQSGFYDDLRKQDAIAFGQNQQILQQLQSTYSPILAAGPNQYGFSADEENDLKTSAAESTSRNYTAAAKTLRENQAAQGGGDSYLPSGVETQQSADLLAAGAHDLSDKQLQIKQAGYAQGYDQFNRAGGAMAGTAGLWNPTAYAGTANQGGSATGETANQISQANSSWEAPLIGAAGAVATGGLSAALTPKKA